MSALCAAVEPLCIDDGSYGMALSSVKNNPWRTKMLSAAEKPGGNVPCGKDFFLGEFGKELCFDGDRLREFGLEAEPYRVENGYLCFQTPASGVWGITVGAGESGKQGGVVPGARWRKVSGNSPVYLEMELEQNVPETVWRFLARYGKSTRMLKEFRVKSGAPVSVPVCRINALTGFGGWSAACGGFRIECTTPGASVKVRKIQLFPKMSEVHWRYEFDLPFEPLSVKYSFRGSPNGTLYANGELVQEGNRAAWRNHVVNVNLTGKLRKGRNVIAYHEYCLPDTTGEGFTAEGAAIGRNGEIVRILGNSDWKTRTGRVAGLDWTKPGYDLSAWTSARAGAETPFNRRIYPPKGTKLKTAEYYSGLKPEHMGVIETSPRGGLYPVFDFNAKKENFGFEVRIPEGMTGIQTVMELQDAETRCIVERKTLAETGRRGGFRIFDGTPGTRKTGAYRVYWSLVREGKEIERRKDELVICGPIEQETVPLGEFEDNLAKRLELIQTIDCTRTDNPPDFFADHRGAGKGKNVGRVVTKNGLTYRETGNRLFDWFAYKLDIREFGTPMLLEVTVPDTAEHYVYVGVEDVYRGIFNNNSRQGWGNASGSVYTGGPWPLSNRKKTLRMVFWPLTKTSCVMISNGQMSKPAAACDIKLYKIKGGLPGLKLPATERVYGYHLERPLHYFWSADYNFRAWEGLYEYNPGDDVWILHYIATKRKIQYLRFQGHNAAIEGLWMYAYPHYDDPENGIVRFSGGMDAPSVVTKLYRHNGIGFYAGVEFKLSKELLNMPECAYSDREIAAGKPGIFCVDKNGFQGNFNSFAPEVENELKKVFRTLYGKYDGNGVRGVYLCLQICLPGIPDTFDDRTVALFEQETGIRLGVTAAGVKRFRERWKLLADDGNGK